MGKQVVGYVVLTLAFHREDKVWVGTCRELGTSTYGRSKDRVEQELQAMVVLHLNALEQEGEREYFFKKHGIKSYSYPPTEARVEQTFLIDDSCFELRTFRIPISEAAEPDREPVAV